MTCIPAMGVLKVTDKSEAPTTSVQLTAGELEQGGPAMRWTLEVVVVPVADVDVAKEFYRDRLGFVVDHDLVMGPGRRLVQLTPLGSGCSIVVGEGVVPAMAPGSLQGLQLVVRDVVAARDALVERGVEVTEVMAVDGDATKVARGGAALDNVGFVYLRDLDGNGWALQQISSRV